MAKRGIPLAAMNKILKKRGANRVSDSAKAQLREIIEKKAEELSEKAIKLASHAGRKTVKKEDIKLAAKQR